MNSANYKCFVISNKPHLFQEMKDNAFPYELIFFDGSKVNSFSQLVNRCASSSPTEIVIMMSDKVMPKKENIEKVLSLLEKGYGLVALYRFAFFGFRKELIRQIGPMDERFVGGGYEDDDFYIRLQESNISMYVTEEVEYKKSRSSWSYSLSLLHFIKKWIPEYDPNIKLHNNKIKRLLPEKSLDYNWGEKTNYKFLDWSHTFVNASKAKKYLKRI